MESRVKLFGHPVHPMLIVFPLGLLGAAVIFDIIYLIWHNASWTEAAYRMIIAGVIGGLLAAVPGTLDWLAIPSATRAKRIGLWHGLGNVLIVVLFIISWALRRPNPAAPPTAALILGFIGLGLALITGWLGGELVERLGIGVDEGAQPNAPSSLSRRPAAGVQAHGRGAF